MVYLYVKQHNVTGLKYFGRTYQNPMKYRGSGTRWLNHLRVHGNDVSTIQVWSFNDLEECSDFAVKFSNENNIISDERWANLIIENAKEGAVYGRVLSEETKAKLKLARAKRGPVSQETRDKLRASRLGKRLSEEAKQKVSAAQKGKKLSVSHIESLKRFNTGKILSDEHKAKISATKQKRKRINADLNK